MVQAALEIMEEVGVDGAKVSEIVRRAGASVGSFYARFPSKDELIEYLEDRVWSEARERWDASVQAEDWAARSLDALIERVVELLLASFEADFKRRRVFGANPQADIRGRRKMQEFHQHVFDTVMPLFAPHLSDVIHADPPFALRLAYRFCVGSVREVLEVKVSAAEDEIPPSNEILAKELARAWRGYLGGREGGVAGGGREVDFFDPWG